MSAISLLTLDLDNTLWDVESIIVTADADMYSWLDQHYPAWRALGMAGFNAIRQQVLTERSDIAHDLSALRLAMLEQLLLATGYDNEQANTGATGAFEVFYSGRNRVVLFDGVADTLTQLAARFPLYALSNGNAQATVVVTDPSKDLAIVHCKSLTEIEPAVVAVHDTLGGQEVMAIGYPGILDDLNASGDSPAIQPTSRNDEFTINPKSIADFVPVTFQGNVGKEMRRESGFGGDFRAIVHSAKISPGNSGGPLIDNEGLVIGTTSWGSKKEQYNGAKSLNAMCEQILKCDGEFYWARD